MHAHIIQPACCNIGAINCSGLHCYNLQWPMKGSLSFFYPRENQFGRGERNNPVPFFWHGFYSCIRTCDWEKLRVGVVVESVNTTITITQSRDKL